MARSPRSIPITIWASERLPDEVRCALDRLAQADDVQRIAVMPDVHLAREVCVGTAFATTTLLYPNAIGGDIGCGMAAVPLDTDAAELAPDHLPALHRALNRAVPIHRQRREHVADLTPCLPPARELSLPALQALAANEGAIQLGTLGTGNHFLELQVDEDDQLWLMVHSGSRGLGQAIRAAHVERAESRARGFAVLDLRTDAGRAYWQDMHWARRFAAANRRAMLEAAGRALDSLLGWSVDFQGAVDCDHNHIEREAHAGVDLLVHRKGAMAAHADRPGVVPGSMAAPSYHVLGRGVPESLCSSAHGAGRAMSRSEARERIGPRRLLRELEDVHVDPRAARGLREEAPSAYKDIHAVMKAQRKLVRIQRTLRPILTHKGVR